MYVLERHPCCVAESTVSTPAPIQPGRRSSLRRSPEKSRRIAFGIRIDAYRLSVVILVALGVALRVREYASDRSLWLDESWLALNIVDRPLAQLFGDLSFNQAAPPGFLLIERTSVALFGPTEYALRLFPLLCGIAALPLFARFAQSLLRPPGALHPDKSFRDTCSKCRKCIEVCHANCIQIDPTSRRGRRIRRR